MSDTLKNEIHQIKSRSVTSIGSLLAQSSYSAVLGFVAFFILTLKSRIYLLGLYNTVLAMMSFFNYLTNLGLAAAIVQKKEVDDIDLNTAFIIQLLLTIIAVIVGFFLTNYLFSFYKDLPKDAVYLYWAVLGSFFFLSLKTIPSTLLEKKIQIYKVVGVQAIENTLFYLAVIVGSLFGLEIYSLIIGVLLRSIVGLIAIYIMQPWAPKSQFSWKSAKSLLKFGIPFQGNSFLALIKDDLMILYLGSAIGFTNLGYVTFAKKYAEFSIRLIMDNVNRVAFPLFSKVQTDVKLLKKSLEKVLFYESAFIFPAIVGTIFIFDSLLKVVPGYFTKWNNTLFSLYFFSLSALFVSLTTPFINLFNAIGKVKLSLYFMILLTVLNWLLIPFFITLFGYLGISIAFFLISLTFIWVLLTAKKFADFSLRDSILDTSIASLIMTLYLIVVRYLFVTRIYNPYLHISLSVIGAGIVYVLILYTLRGKELYKEIISYLSSRT